VTARLERQAVLYDEGRQFEFVLTEAVLRWRPGPPGLLLAQLDRLLSMATLPNVRLGVVPLDREAAAVPANGLTVFDTAEEAVVLVETLTTESFLTGERHLEVYRQAFARFRDAALFGPDATAAITPSNNNSKTCGSAPRSRWDSSCYAAMRRASASSRNSLTTGTPPFDRSRSRNPRSASVARGVQIDGQMQGLAAGRAGRVQVALAQADFGQGGQVDRTVS